MKIGILLGSFDPIHIGHIAIVSKVLNEELVDKVLFLPAVQNPWKYRKAVSVDLRADMIRSAMYESGFSNDQFGIEIVSKQNEDGNYYTFDQLEALKNLYARDIEFVILGGTDTVKDMSKWYRGEELLKNWNTVEISRPGFCSEVSDMSITVSSSAIRNLLRNNKIPLPWITKGTWDIIKANGLYRD
jgi:probable nicotinate-nucleotide adenylyltransferase